MTLDFPSPSPLLVRRDHSCVPSPWPCFGHWPMMRSQDHGFQPSLCSCLPKAFLLHTSWGEPLVYSHARLLLPWSGRCCCRSWAGSRKWQLSVHETHAQLLREQKLYNLMLLPCLSEPCRGWWQNTQRRPRKAKYLLPLPLEHMMHGAAFRGGPSWDSGVQRVSPSWGVGVGGKGGGGAPQGWQLHWHAWLFQPKEVARSSLGDARCLQELWPLLGQRGVCLRIGGSVWKPWRF